MADSLREHGPWKIKESRDVYSDPWLRVQRDEVVRPDGDDGSYVVAHLKAGVSVIAVDSNCNVHLTQEFHYGVGRETLEAVSGGIDEGETPLEAAQRELREELGIEAHSWDSLGVTDPFTANVVSPTSLFLAQELVFRDQQLEGTEQIQHVTIPLGAAIEKVLSGEISHAPSGLAILKAMMVIEGRFYAPPLTR